MIEPREVEASCLGVLFEFAVIGALGCLVAWAIAHAFSSCGQSGQRFSWYLPGLYFDGF